MTSIGALAVSARGAGAIRCRPITSPIGSTIASDEPRCGTLRLCVGVVTSGATGRRFPDGYREVRVGTKRLARKRKLLRQVIITAIGLGSYTIMR